MADTPVPITILRMDQIQSQLLQLLADQIQARKDMMNQMVGSLYPSILQSEIWQLITWKDGIK
jgi:hypothetical protein